MYAQLGNIRFEGLKGFTSFEKQNGGVNYAEHERIMGKPRLEAVGEGLDTISFDMYLNAAFTNPEADIDALRTAMLNREILPLILGNGRVVGNFVIPNFSESTGFTDPSGNLIEVTISVELKESFTEDALRDAKKKAQADAFATETRNTNVRSIMPLKLSPGAVVTKDVYAIETSGKLTEQHVTAVEKNPATASYYSAKIGKALDTIEQTIGKVTDAINAAQGLDEGQLMPSALNGVNSQVQNMRAALPITDVNSFKVFLNGLKGSIGTLKTANTITSNKAIIRRV